jgi:hypothetical protein
MLGLLDEAVEAVISQVEAYGDASPSYRFHGGEMVGADVALGILLGELLVHGYDLARTMRRSWPVTREQVSLIWSGVEPILPGWVYPDRSAGPGCLPGPPRRQSAAPALLHRRQAEQRASSEPQNRLPHRRQPAGHPAHLVSPQVPLSGCHDRPRRGVGKAPMAGILGRGPVLPTVTAPTALADCRNLAGRGGRSASSTWTCGRFA